MSNNSKNVIRILNDNDFDGFVDIVIRTYPGIIPDSFSKDTKQHMVERFKKTHNETSWIKYYGYFQEEKLLGGMILFDFIMNIFSNNINVGGVGLVCVDLLNKKEHIAKNLIDFFHKHYYDKGISLTILYPFRPDFYIKFGYGMGKKMNQYSFKPDSVPKTTKLHLSYLNNADIPHLVECFNRYASQTHGMIFREERTYQHMIESMFVVGDKQSNQIQGYIAFKFKKLSQNNFVHNDIVIEEFVYENRIALAELLTFLNIQSDQIHRITYNTQDDFFHHLLADPRNGTNNLYLTSHESNLQAVGIMYRVINTRKIFTLLKNHNFGGQTVTLRLLVKDNFVPENNDELFIYFNNGFATINKDMTNYDVQIQLDIANFSSMIMGVISFEKLYTYGLADISNLDYLAKVTKVFLVEQSPMTIEQF